MRIISFDVQMPDPSGGVTLYETTSIRQALILSHLRDTISFCTLQRLLFKLCRMHIYYKYAVVVDFLGVSLLTSGLDIFLLAECPLDRGKITRYVMTHVVGLLFFPVLISECIMAP